MILYIFYSLLVPASKAAVKSCQKLPAVKMVRGKITINLRDSSIPRTTSNMLICVFVISHFSVCRGTNVISFYFSSFLLNFLGRQKRKKWGKWCDYDKIYLLNLCVANCFPVHKFKKQILIKFRPFFCSLRKRWL